MDEEEAEALVDELADVIGELEEELPFNLPLNVAYRVDGSPILGKSADT